MNLSRFSLAALCVAVLTSVSFAQTPGSIVSVTASYTASPTNRLIIVNAASNATITLAAGAIAGQEVTVVQNGTAPNTVTIVSPGTLVDPNGLAYMGGTACGTGESVHLIADGAGTWYVLDGNNNNCSNNSTNAPATAQTKVAKGTVDGQTLYWDNTAKLWKTSTVLKNVSGSSQVTVTGALKYVDGNQAAGKVLTTDASGNATWQVAGSGSSSVTLYSKGADQAVSAVGMVSDNTLTGIAIGPNESYAFEGFLLVNTSNGTADFQYQWHASGAMNFDVFSQYGGPNTTAASAFQTIPSGNTTNTVTADATAGDDILVMIHGTITNKSGASKTWELQWTPNGAGTTTVKAGSFLRVTKM